MPYLLSVVLLLFVTACTPPQADIQDFINEVQQGTSTTIEPGPYFIPEPAYQYQSAHLRSPFEPIRALELPVVLTPQANCLQPDLNRQFEPLENYGLDAMSYNGSIQQGTRQIALIQTNDNRVFKIAIGQYLGLFHGQLKAISADKLLIQQYLPDGAGCYQLQVAELLYSGKGNLNE